MKNNKKLLKLFIIITLIIVIIVITILGVLLLNKKEIKTISQRKEEGFENLDESKYPGYKEKLKAIQKEHPNWNFTILYTGLNWDDVILNESEANHSINLVDGSAGGVSGSSSVGFSDGSTLGSSDGSTTGSSTYVASV